VGIELLFRGFMVIGMASVLGRAAVVPMVVTYCFLHFGKPAGEAVSSIFGGFILGVIAYETRSIWGGIIIHVGIAWAMELAAYWQKS
jgi:membrane protease YdiL (CAAX protease family)